MPDDPKANVMTEPLDEGGASPSRKKHQASDERSYYYDDAHGYENYDPAADGDDEEEE